MEHRAKLTAITLAVTVSALLLATPASGVHVGVARANSAKNTTERATDTDANAQPAAASTTTTSSVAALYPFLQTVESSPRVLHDGAYLGVSIGYDTYKARANYANPALAENTVYTPSGFLGNLLLGYGHYFKNIIYLGIETFLNGTRADSGHSASTNTPTSTFYGTMNIKGSYGFAIMPGIKMGDASLFYLRFGYINSRFKTNESSNVGGVMTNNLTTNWLNGYTNGLGLETAVYGNVSMRAEYNHTTYNSFHTGAGTIYNPSDNQAMLSVLYHFA